MFAGTFKGYTSLNDMQNIHADLLNKEFKINTDGISEFTTAQIQAKAAAMGLTNSLTTQLVGIGKDANFIQKVTAGNITWGKALKDNTIDINSLGDALLKSNKVSNEAKNALKTVTEQCGKSSDAYKNVVNSIIDGTSGFENISDSIIDIGTTTTQSTSILSGFKATLTGIAASAKSLFTTLATNPLTWLVAAGVAAVALEDALTIDYGEAHEALQESSQKYQDTKTNLESLNTELGTTQSRIEELQALKDAGTITFAEDNELENLNTQLLKKHSIKCYSF